MQVDKKKKEEVAYFLKDFHEKMDIWGVLFIGRSKNFETLSLLELRPVQREQILRDLNVEDYSQGPLEENWHGGKEMWVFGKHVKSHETYIKISIGAPGTNAICISFHIAEHPMNYPFKNHKK